MAVSSQGRTRGPLERARRNWFDSEAILRGMTRAERKALSKFGAYTRQTARQLLRYRVAASKPGHPPSVHKAGMRTKTNRKGVTKKQAYSPLRDFLYFSFEPETHSVVIGPVLLQQSSGKAHPAPEVLEKSGDSLLVRHLKSGSVKKQQVHIEARPTMAPAFDKELPKLAGYFRGEL